MLNCDSLFMSPLTTIMTLYIWKPKDTRFLKGENIVNYTGSHRLLFHKLTLVMRVVTRLHNFVTYKINK